jgi:hypothetical protein
MTRLFRTAFIAAALIAVPALAKDSVPSIAAGHPPPSEDRLDADSPKIQIAILLDTSSSMDGLIGQAKSQLWKVVNAFTTARREGRRARLEIALYEYGNDGLPAEAGYIRQVLPLTTDLDKVSEKLFALKTNGGEEYCGKVIQTATQGLEWSKNKKDLKLIYIAGNEPFGQGPVDYHVSVKAAVERGITVNTIHCGSEQVGATTGWKDGALLADGNFMIIDQNKAVAYIEAPQDKEIAKLGTELNKTYLGYGVRAKEAAANQMAQDSNAFGAGMNSAVTRAASKASAHYDNSGWDLVDAKKNGKDVAEMKDEELPAEMRKMSKDERRAHVEKLEKQRAELQSKIQKLNEEREKHVSAEMKKRGEGDKLTFDAEMIGSVKSQGAKVDFSF